MSQRNCANTEFGELILNLLDSRGDYQKDMAAKCNVAPSYISGIISGTKRPSKNFISKLKKEYKLTDLQEKILLDAQMNAMLSVRIDLTLLTKNKRDLAIAFRNVYKYLSDEDCDEIMKILTEHHRT